MGAVGGKVRGQNNTVWNYLGRRPTLVTIFTGAAVALAVLGMGLVLVKAHGNGWPWWFHGVITSLVAGLLAAFLTNMQVREMKRYKARLLAMDQVSDEVCNALQLLAYRMYLHPEMRARLEDAALERIRNIIRETLPNIIGMPPETRPPQLPPSAGGKQSGAATGGNFLSIASTRSPTHRAQTSRIWHP